MKLALAHEFQAAMQDQARAAYPAECCGLIEGKRDGDLVHGLALHPARNIAARRDRFEIDPQDHFAALKAALTNGRAIIGCYHSHPGGTPTPSQTDHAGAGEEDFLWLIAALGQADGPVTLAAFVYCAACFLPVAFTNLVGADLVTSSE